MNALGAPARVRWIAAAWLVLWVPVYAAHWGWLNFLQVCDLAIAIACLGLLVGSPLLLSSQALPSIVVGAVWTADVAARAATGRHLVGGTEYMWDARVPVPVRLLSLFHVVLPVVLVAAVRRTGYDRRALSLQTALTLVVLVASRLMGDPESNPNYAFRDPLFGRSFGPAPAHVATILAGAVVLVYLPTHLALRRWCRPRDWLASPVGASGLRIRALLQRRPGCRRS